MAHKNQRRLDSSDAKSTQELASIDKATQGWTFAHELRPSAKVLPEHARIHNRSLVLQALYRSGPQSRADIARSTGLARVTVSHLVSEFVTEGLVVELGRRPDPRRGKPATLLGISVTGFQIVGIDLSDHALLRGAVLDLYGNILVRQEIDLAGSMSAEVVTKVISLGEQLISRASSPVLGIGVGSPGIVNLDGVVLSAPNLGWSSEPLQEILEAHFSLPVVVANDANAAALAEFSFGGADRDLMLVKVGRGVGAGLILGGAPIYGSRFAAGEMGHVTIGTDGRFPCICGKSGCLETWLATPRLNAALAAAIATGISEESVLAEAGRRLGIALASVVGALNLAEIVLSGPIHLLDGTLLNSTRSTVLSRATAEFHENTTIRMTSLGDDIVMRGAAVMVLSAQLGVS